MAGNCVGWHRRNADRIRKVSLGIVRRSSDSMHSVNHSDVTGNYKTSVRVMFQTHSL